MINSITRSVLSASALWLSMIPALQASSAAAPMKTTPITRWLKEQELSEEPKTSLEASPDQRSLSGYSSVSCSLTPEVFRAVWDADRESFTFLNPNETVAGFDSFAEYLGSLPEDQYQDVRVCWCTREVMGGEDYEFCPVEFDTCSVKLHPKEGRRDVSCFNQRKFDTFAKAFWPVVIFWTVAVVYAWSCSDHGKTARQYLRRTICGGSAQTQLNRFLSDQPEQAVYFYQRSLLRTRRQRMRRQRRHEQWWYIQGMKLLGRPIPEEPTTEEGEEDFDESHVKLALKTKVFHDTSPPKDEETGSPPSFVTVESSIKESDGEEEEGVVVKKDDEDESRPQCVICLLDLEEGDVIGDIPCGHMLHKECLKDWLKRKNKCPLCQHAGIASLYSR